MHKVSRDTYNRRGMSNMQLNDGPHGALVLMVRRLGINYLTGNSLYCAVKRFNSMHKAL